MSNRPSRALAALNAALVVALFTLAVVLLFAFASPEPFNPISYSPDPRPVQRLADLDDGSDDRVRVVPSVNGYERPAVRLGETVPTTGVVCNDAGYPVDVLADLTWERWDVRGLRVFELTDFPSTIEPDCTALAFENPIPDEVIQSVRSGGAQQWVITGAATPIEPGGVVATWRIEPFWVVP